MFNMTGIFKSHSYALSHHRASVALLRHLSTEKGVLCFVFLTILNKTTTLQDGTFCPAEAFEKMFPLP